MRRGYPIFIFTCFCLFFYGIHSVWTLLNLLVDDSTTDIISQEELLEYDTTRQLIPKIIHQTYKNTSIPTIWQAAQISCIDLHPDWQYMFWTDESSQAFIADEYPWFLETFDGYEHNIQRADAIRYFVLRHYGGIYIDLDDGCNRSLEPLLSFDAFVRKTTPTGVSNDVMGSTRDHPFFNKVTEELVDFDYSWLLPYITVMSSTGPLFLSIIWKHWTLDGLNIKDRRVRILDTNEYMGSPTSFFTHHQGNSWHGPDVVIINWLHDHWILVTTSCTVTTLLLIFCAWSLYRRYILEATANARLRSSPAQHCTSLKRHEHQLLNNV